MLRPAPRRRPHRQARGVSTGGPRRGPEQPPPSHQGRRLPPERNRCAPRRRLSPARRARAMPQMFPALWPELRQPPGPPKSQTSTNRRHAGRVNVRPAHEVPWVRTHQDVRRGRLPERPRLHGQTCAQVSNKPGTSGYPRYLLPANPPGPHRAWLRPCPHLCLPRVRAH